MTWSIVHDVTYDTTVTADKLDGWVYYMETYLPSKGYTVSVGETAGVGSVNSNEEWYGVSRTYTSFAGDGQSYTHYYVVELEGQYADITVWNWDGTPGGGSSSVQYGNSSYTSFIPSNTNSSRWIILESDQDTEHWCVFVDGSLLAFNVNKDLFFPGVDRDVTTLTNVVADPSTGSPYFTVQGGSSTYSMGGCIPGGNTTVLTGGAYYFGTQMGWGGGARFFGFMDKNDIALRLTGSGVPYATLRSSSYQCKTFEIDGEYWLDMAPSLSASMMINTGTNNYNNLQTYTGMP